MGSTFTVVHFYRLNSEPFSLFCNLLQLQKSGSGVEMMVINYGLSLWSSRVSQGVYLDKLMQCMDRSDVHNKTCNWQYKKNELDSRDTTHLTLFLQRYFFQLYCIGNSNVLL